MNKLITILVLVLATSCTLNQPEKDISASSQKAKTDTTKGRVTGIGGVFFKSTDPKKSREWYHQNLGLVINEYGSMFEFRLSDEPDQKGYLQWSPFTDKTSYFEPSEKEFMINYRVVNIEALLKDLRKNGVEILDTVAEYEYGKFVHIMDNEGNKIELWEPIYGPFTKEYEGQTTK